jgi:NDP-hexose-3-ketoreductase
MIAIIGFGQHIQTNILPALERLGICVKYIFVRNLNKVKENQHLKYFVDDLNLILNDPEVKYVYIATPISTHYYYSKIVIEYNKNVICEKPITTNVCELNYLYELADSRDVSIQQVVMYKYHKAYNYVKRLIKTSCYGNLKQVGASFKIPHLNENNIRYNKQLNGGALFDVGFYPLSFMVSLFDDMKMVSSIIKSEENFDVDLSGIAVFENSNILGVAQWGIGSCYENIVVFDFELARVTIERFFSKPETYEVTANIVDTLGNKSVVSIGKDDQFTNMISSMLITDEKERVGDNTVIIQVIEKCAQIAKCAQVAL